MANKAFTLHKFADNSDHNTAMRYFYVCTAVCAYVCDHVPPTQALIIKESPIVTHSNANPGMLTHTYHALQVEVSHFNISDFF